jgi:hypothetical protein
LSPWHYQFGPTQQSKSFDLSCYHIVDEYPLSSVEPLDEPEVAVISGVDPVFVTSPGLLEKKGWLNPNTELIPEGVESRDYSTAKPEPSDLAPVPHPCTGYTGWLKKKLDWRLLREFANGRPNWSFAFVGGQLPHPEIDSVIRELSGRHNVWFLGRRSSARYASLGESDRHHLCGTTPSGPGSAADRAVHGRQRLVITGPSSSSPVSAHTVRQSRPATDGGPPARSRPECHGLQCPSELRRRWSERSPRRG